MSGRPRALDDSKCREICAIVSAGGDLCAAARYVGCDVVTIRRETMRNHGFFAELRRAELESQLTPMKTVQKAAATHWRAAAWYLERTQPNRFLRQAPGRFTLEQLQEALEKTVCPILERVDDDATRDLILRCVGETAQKYHLEVRAMNRVFYDVGRRRRQMLKQQAMFERCRSQDAKVPELSAETARDVEEVADVAPAPPSMGAA